VEIREGLAYITLTTPAHKNNLLAYLSDKHIGVDSFAVVEPTLEDIFVEKAGSSV
jgi:ABC-type uncharacterized transport system ATPase subunit